MKKVIVILLFFACSASIPPSTYSQETDATISGATFGAAGEAVSLIAIVKNPGGQPVSGVSVAFDTTGSPSGATGLLNAGSVDTDSNGEALVTFTFGDSLGLYTVRGIANNDTVIFNLKALTDKETRRRLLGETEQLINQSRQNNSILESGIKGQSKGKNAVNLSKLPSASEKTDIEADIDTAMTDAIGLLVRVRDLK